MVLERSQLPQLKRALEEVNLNVGTFDFDLTDYVFLSSKHSFGLAKLKLHL